jgi:predicted lipoprotein with Yx(FWY)xxD motif
MRRRASGVAAVLFTAVALAVAGCASTAGNSAAGSTGSGHGSGAAAGSTGSGHGSGAAAGGKTVEVRTVGALGPTLVTADGKTLYFTDQDSSSQIMCVQGCVHFWVPLTVPSGTTPTGTDDLSTAARPDGPTQVLFRGKPLYTFSLDSGAGEADGDGVSDSFAGTTFTWHAATVSGATAAPSPAGSGGYRY